MKADWIDRIRGEMWRNRNWGWPTETGVICSFHREYDFDNKTVFMAQGVKRMLRTLPKLKLSKKAGKWKEQNKTVNDRSNTSKLSSIIL